MKNFYIILVVLNLFCSSVFATTDKTSIDYLKNKKHFSMFNPLAESCIEKIIQKALKKEIGKGTYKVRFDGYTLSSMKQGIFKSLVVKAKNLVVDGIPVNYLELNTITDYNWIDFKNSSIKTKSDIIFDYKLELSENSLNQALENKDYQKVINKINLKAYPLFELKNVKIKIKYDKIYLVIDYFLPLRANKKFKTFIVSSDFNVIDGKIKAQNVHIDKAYGNLPLDKVINLVNFLDPLSFTLDVLKDDYCNGKVENIKINNNNIQISGKIFIKKGE